VVVEARVLDRDDGLRMTGATSEIGTETRFS
jgi:hypothetical protein